MRDSKSTFLIFIPVFLLLVCLALLFKWGYQLNRLQNKQQQIIETAKKDDASVAVNNLRDSLQKIYAATVNKLDNNLSTLSPAPINDSLNKNLQTKITEFNQLKTDISSLLKKAATSDDLELAKLKITELQVRVEQLSKRNKDVEDENKRLNALLAQLTTAIKEREQNNNRNNSAAETKTPVTNVTPVNNTVSTAPPNPNFSASDLRLTVVAAANNGETNDTEEAEKVIASFALRNTIDYNNTEVAVVILRPDGQVLKNSEWETGTFDTKEGRKFYSYKTRFEYNKGETKRVNFSINAENLPKGNYIMQVYHNGAMIGRLQKPLS